MADLLRQSEENGNRLRNLETGIDQLRTDQDQRIATLEQRMSERRRPPPPAGVEPGPTACHELAKPKPAPGKPRSAKDRRSDSGDGQSGDCRHRSAATDVAKMPTRPGFHAWEAGQYDQAIAQLKAFTAAYPKHRRASYANNLIGRAMLDKGDARGAAAALLSNYRNNPGGERAPDSLLYLGQALMKLGQPGQACKAYQELDAVYGAKIRPDLRQLETNAKAQAQCS